MTAPELRAKRSARTTSRADEARLGLAVMLATVTALGGLAAIGVLRDHDAGGAAAVSMRGPQGVPHLAAVTTTTTVAKTKKTLPDLEGVAVPPDEACTIEPDSLRQGDTGEDVACLQRALADIGAFKGRTNGTFDAATYEAVRQLQEKRELFVDGVVGRETALSVGIWPDEESFVVRTPKPRPGAVDLLGYPLSSVASAGKKAPLLPPNSGSGKRVVYSRAGQRVWAVDADGRIVRSWLVSGSKYSNEVPGTHEIYSRSDVSTAWNGKAWLPLMIRWYETDIGHIGFHAIPLHVEDDSPYQTEAELGTRLSGGCQRQANADAKFLWDFAPVGTTVVVV